MNGTRFAKWFQHGVDPNKLDEPYTSANPAPTVRQWLQSLSILSETLWLEAPREGPGLPGLLRG